MSTLASVVVRDLIANRPAAGIGGRFFIATDQGNRLYRDNGTSWDDISHGMILVESHTASGSSPNLDFTSWYSSAFDEYLIEFVNIIPATNGVTLTMNCSTNGGSSYDSSAIYDAATTYATASSAGGDETEGNTAFTIAGNISTASGNSLNAFVRLFNPGGSAYKTILCYVTYRLSTNGKLNIGSQGGSYKNTTAVNAFRLAISSGNLSSGSVRVYGMVK